MDGVNGAAVNGPAMDEAARLAEAQRERLAKRSEENAKAALAPQAQPAAEPKLVAQCSVKVYDNQKCDVNFFPVGDFDGALEMIRILQVALINTARAQGVEIGKQQAAAAPRVPFMKRVFGKRGANA